MGKIQTLPSFLEDVFNTNTKLINTTYKDNFALIPIGRYYNKLSLNFL